MYRMRGKDKKQNDQLGGHYNRLLRRILRREGRQVILMMKKMDQIPKLFRRQRIIEFSDQMTGGKKYEEEVKDYPRVSYWVD